MKLKPYTKSEAKLVEMANPLAQECGARVVDLKIGGGAISLFVDKPGGVTVQDCTEISRELSTMLDVEDPMRGSYRLEVSSPGLTRKLTRIEHFQEALGKKAEVVLRDPLDDGRRLLQGELVKLTESDPEPGATLQLDEDRITISFEAMKTAKLVYDVRIPKKKV